MKMYFTGHLLHASVELYRPSILLAMEKHSVTSTFCRTTIAFDIVPWVLILPKRASGLEVSSEIILQQKPPLQG